MIEVLFWITTICIIVGATLQVINKKNMYKSFIFIFIGALASVIAYSITGQPAQLILNLYTSILAIRGLWIWKNS